MINSVPSLLHFVFITGVLGGGGAWLAGRAVALTWRPPVMVVGVALLMALAVRFIHFALFGESLLAWTSLGIEIAVLLAVTSLSYRWTRARQMVRQYYWLYEPHGLLGWRRRGDQSA